VIATDLARLAFWRLDPAQREELFAAAVREKPWRRDGHGWAKLTRAVELMLTEGIVTPETPRKERTP
jgi:hypothetical protein